MRRLWAVAAVATMFGGSGCGTILNMTDIDGKGREPYGGVAREANFFFKTVPEALPSHWGPMHMSGGGSAKGAIVTLALIPSVYIAYFGCAAAEMSLSLAGDVATAPVIPWINRRLGVELPSERPGVVTQVAVITPPTTFPAVDEGQPSDLRNGVPLDLWNGLPPLVFAPPAVEAKAESKWYSSEFTEPPAVSAAPVLGLKQLDHDDPPELTVLPKVPVLVLKTSLDLTSSERTDLTP